MNKRISDFDLERYVLGELKSTKYKMVHRAIMNSNDLKKKVEEIRKSNISVLEEVPAHLFSAQVNSRIERESLEKSFFNGRVFHVASLMFVLVIIGMLVPWVNQPSSNTTGVWLSSQSSERIKGESFAMLIHKKTNNSVELMSDGDVVKEGDLLQISIKHLNPIHAIVVSIDGRGYVTKHFPNELGSDFIEGQGVLNLPYSYELDDAPLFEKFVLITSDNKISIDEAIAKVKKNNLEDVEQEIILKKALSND